MIQFRYAPETNAILILIQISSSDTVQIRSKHGFHFDTHSKSASRYSSDTMHIRSRHGYHSDTPLDAILKIHYRYAPDSDAILILILSAYKL